MLGRGATWPLNLLAAWTGVLLATRLLFGYAVRMGLFTRSVLLLGSEGEAARTAAAIAGAAARPVPHRRQLALPDRAGHDAPELPPRRLWGVIVGDGAAQSLPTGAARQLAVRGLRVLHEAAFWERHLGRVDTACRCRRRAADARWRGWSVLSRGLDLAFASRCCC